MSEPAHNYYVSTDPKALDLAWTLAELQKTYFGATRTMDQLVEQCRASLCFGVYRRDYLGEGFPSHRDQQVGFARVLHDGVFFGWLADFLIADSERGKGNGHALMHVITTHHALKNVTLNLVTRDAQEFYGKFGFTEERHMMRRPT